MPLALDLQERVRLEVTYLLASLSSGESTLIRADAAALCARLAALDASTRAVHFSAPVAPEKPLLWASRALLVSIEQLDLAHIASLSTLLRIELALPDQSPVPAFA